MNIVKQWLTNHVAAVIIFFLAVFTLINPFPHTTTVREICFYGAALFFVLLLLVDRQQLEFCRTPLFIPMGLFILWVVVGFFWALDKPNSWHDMYTFLFRYTFLGLLFALFFKEPNKMRFLAWLIVISLVAFLSFKLVKFYQPGGASWGSRFYASNEGMTSNLISISIIFSCFLIYCNMATIKSYWRFAVLPLYIPLLAALVLSQARSAFIALAISSLVFVFVQRKLLVVVLVAALALVVLFTPLKNRFNVDLTKDPRVSHALLVMEVVKDHPLTGIGFGMETFKKLDLNAYKKKMEKDYAVPYCFQGLILNDPHCIYTDILVRTGLIGFALFLCCIFYLFKMIWLVSCSRDRDRRLWALGVGCSLGSFFVIAAFEPVFSHVQVFYLTLMISFVSILWRQEMT